MHELVRKQPSWRWACLLVAMIVVVMAFVVVGPTPASGCTWIAPCKSDPGPTVQLTDRQTTGSQAKDTDSSQNNDDQDQSNNTNSNQLQSANQTGGDEQDDEPPKKSAKQLRKEYEAEVARLTAEYERLLAIYRAEVATFNQCVDTIEIATGEAQCAAPSVPDLPDVPEPPAGVQFPGLPQVVISGEAAAYVAVASLGIPAPKVGVGPDPKLNEWEMAVVGYPLWLWADGPKSLGPVSQSVGPASVTLSARLSKMVFKMGDGEQVTCHGPGSVWTMQYADKDSPTCGYRYQEPSLPDGTYTITAIAYWTVDWATSTESGTFTVPAYNSRELPVGELQAVVR